jgi:hypothetical protein
LLRVLSAQAAHGSHEAV